MANWTSLGMSTSTGPGRPLRRDVERLVQHARQVGDVLDQPVVLGAGPGDADGVALLEGVVADQKVGTWPVSTTIGIESISASVRPVTALVAPGPEVTSTHADLAGRARVAFGRVHGALLVAHEDVADVVLLEHRVVDRQHRAARIAENVLDALIAQGLDHHLGAGHLSGHRRLLRNSSFGQ